MLFNTLQYALFLPIVVLLFWLSPQKFRLGILLLASYIFYMSWRPIYVLLILGLTLINYWFGIKIADSTLAKKKWLTLAVTSNLSALAFFKYTFFLDQLLIDCLKPLHFQFPTVGFNIILPLGISFFVFEFIHYVVDIYRGHEPVRSLPGFALFASFFPTQIAGPIKRYQDFVPQFLKPSKWDLKSFDDGVLLIFQGLCKKALFADNLALFVQGGFEHVGDFTGLDLWLFAYAFAFQIYFDFSGYTDVAQGSAMLFGYKVPMNFNLPYLAKNISDFWHRWHISLSTWLRDYLFIPLGGSRCGRLKNHFNLLATMTLGGLWHGAAMHYVAWGVFHGLMLIAHKEFQFLQAKLPLLASFFKSLPGRIFSMLLTFHVVCIGWVYFRAETFAAANGMIAKMLGMNWVWQMNLPAINFPLIYPSIYLVLPLLFAGHLLMGWLSGKDLFKNCPIPLKASYCLMLVLLVMVFSPDKSPRFIYFQF